MTDAHLRELERRFRATGSVEDEASWLRARVQAGEVSEDRLELAAHLGHLASLSVVSSGAAPASAAPAIADCSEVLGLVRWSREIAEFGLEAWVAAILPLADDDAICWEQMRHRPSANLKAPSVAVEAARQWLACPCPTHFERAVEAGKASTIAARAAEPLSIVHGAALFCGSLVDTPPDPTNLRLSPFAVGDPLAARIRMERGAVEWLVGHAVGANAFEPRPQRVEDERRADPEWIHVRRVESHLGCEALKGCRNPLAVNVLGDEFDLWLCAEHALDLSRRLARAADPEAHGQ